MRNTLERSDPIQAHDARILTVRWGQASEAIMTHLAAGSPTHGPRNAFMARGHLWSLHSHLSKVLERELTGDTPLPMAETADILMEDWEPTPT